METDRVWIQDCEYALKKAEAPLIIKPKDINLVFDFDGVITQPQDLKASILQQMGYDITPEQTDKQNAHKLMLQQKPQKGMEGIKNDYEAMIHQLYVKRMFEVGATQLGLTFKSHLKKMR